MGNALRISKTIMKGTIPHNREGGIFEQKVKYIEKDLEGGVLAGKCDGFTG